MNKKLALFIVTTVVLIPTLIFAGPFDLFKKSGGTAGSSKVDIQALTNRSASIISKVYLANVGFAEASANILDAVGNAESAEKLKTTLSNVKGKKDIESLKSLVGEVNNAVDQLNKIDLQAKIDLVKARISLGKSILNFGAGTILDLSVVPDAKALFADAKNALQTVQAAPMQYGPTAVSSVTAVVTAAQFIVESIPVQAQNIQTFGDKLIQYAKTNGIEVPSQADIEKRSKEMEKE